MQESFSRDLGAGGGGGALDSIKGESARAGEPASFWQEKRDSRLHSYTGLVEMSWWRKQFIKC